MVIHDLDDDWGMYLHFRKTPMFWLLSWEVLGGLGMSWDVTGRSGTLWKGHLQLYLPLSHYLHSCRGARSNLHKIQTTEGIKFHHVSPIQDPCQSSTEGSEGLKAGRDAASLQLRNPMTSSGSTSSDSQPSCPWGARQHDLDHIWINQIWVCMKMIEHVWNTTQFPWFSIIFLIQNHYIVGGIQNILHFQTDPYLSVSWTCCIPMYTPPNGNFSWKMMGSSRLGDGALGASIVKAWSFWEGKLYYSTSNETEVMEHVGCII